MTTNTPTDTDDSINPRPTDPLFLFAILRGARRSGDRMLEKLACGWLLEHGIKVVFISKLPDGTTPSSASPRG